MNMKYSITFSDLTPEQVNLLGNAIAEGLNWKSANPFMAALQQQIAQQEAAAQQPQALPPQAEGGASGEPLPPVVG